MKNKPFYFFYSSLCLLLVTMMPVSVTVGMDNEERKRRTTIEQLKNLSLGELIEVETFNPKGGLAARKIQKLTETAAALFVITQEDIRRAGITRLSEALRMVPGVQVARINPRRWAITARGFNGDYSSKLLVMIDGRTVYTPLRSEVYWDVQDTLIEDIERIEVIRGPGASLWGANAVNGIINIITKSATDTQGNLVTTHFGNGEERAILGIRHGGELDIGNGGHYRVYAKFYEHDHFVDSQGEDQQDHWQVKRGGFRMDWEATDKDIVTVQGDIYDGLTQQKTFVMEPVPGVINDKGDISGLNLLTRWQRNLTNGDMRLQGYYDLTQRDDISLGELRGTLDLDFQHRWQWHNKQEFMWGLGFRHTYDDIDSSPALTYVPAKRQDNLYSAFVQNEFNIPLSSPLQKTSWGKALRLTLGSKFEHNDYSGFEIQPTARLLWHLNDKHSAWTAISRAVRTPSRTDTNIKMKPVDMQNTRILGWGNPDFQAEELLAYELGYRFNLTNQFLLDTTFFYHDYDKLRSLEIIDFQPFPPPPLIVIQTDNQKCGEVYGAEIAASWQILDIWKLISTYSYLDVHLHLKPNSRALFGETDENDTPHHQATLRSLLSLPHNLELDTAWYYVDNLPNQNTPHYSRFDIRIGWQPQSHIELGFGVRNLFDKQHREFGDGFNSNITLADEIRRAIFMQFKYRF